MYPATGVQVTATSGTIIIRLTGSTTCRVALHGWLQQALTLVVVGAWQAQQHLVIATCWRILHVTC